MPVALRKITPVVVDFETYWAQDYTLKANKLCNLNTAQYIRDPRFSPHGAGVKVGDDEPVWVPRKSLKRYFKSLPRRGVAVVAHHNHFDGLILAEHFDYVPEFYFCTLAMGRALHGARVRGQLESLAPFYGVGEKIRDVLSQTKGIRDLSPDLEQKLALYCLMDVNLCLRLFELMRKKFTERELWLIDCTVRMYTQPRFGLNRRLAERAVAEERAEKERLLNAAEATEEELQSSEKLAKRLIALGVTPPEKWSAKQDDWTWAFAQTDFEFMDLINSENPKVHALIRARLAVKSTIGERRAERLLKVGSPIPIYLNYCGAHTTRWSGGDKINPQNFPRADKDDPKNTGLLRQALVAPAGHKVVVFDSGQIEARMLAWLAGQEDLLEAFRDPTRDVYCELASDFYGRTITKADINERFIGKVGRLGLGFQMGPPKLRFTLALGIMGPPVFLDLPACQRLVDVYRRKSQKIVMFWSLCTKMIEAMFQGETYEYGPLTIEPNRIKLPSGLYLDYPKLSYQLDQFERPQWTYYNREKPVHIYGGLLTENIDQALSRCVIGDQMYEIGQQYPISLMSHDEIACIVPNRKVKSCMLYMHDVMTAPIPWAPGLPLTAEGGAFSYYGKP